MDCDSLVDTDDDSGCVEHEEHENSGNENQGKVSIVHLTRQSPLDGFIAYKKVKLVRISSEAGRIPVIPCGEL